MPKPKSSSTPKTPGKRAAKSTAKAAPKRRAAADAGEAVAPQPAVADQPAEQLSLVRRKSPPKSAALVKEIALRAYFISEKRQQVGQPGDRASDWVEAERQVLSESSIAGNAAH